MVIAWAVLALALLSPVARADEPSPLGQAKLAIEQVRYDDAQRLLISALEQGGNPPVAVREIYKLLGASAVALGKIDDAEKYYRAWIALDPKAALDAGASPKFRAPFDAAKSYITANGPLDISVQYVTREDVRVRVLSDPLALARTARGDGAAVGIVDGTAVVYGDGLVEISDRYGNTLAEIAPTRTSAPNAATASGSPNTTLSTSAPPTGAVYSPALRSPTRSTAFYVLAIPTGLLLATSAGLGAASIFYHREVQTALEDSGAHYYDDIVAKQTRVTQFWKLSAVIGGAGVVLAIPTAILYFRDQRSPLVMPYTDGTSTGAAISGRF